MRLRTDNHFPNGTRAGRSSVKRWFNLDQRGFTLVEVILVIVFSSIVFFAAVNMTSESVTSSFSTEVVTSATSLANEKMERILSDKKSLGYAHIAAGNYSTESTIEGYPGFTRSVNITTYTDHKKVEVVVSHSSIADCILVALLANY